jgi:hypothetical protein
MDVALPPPKRPDRDARQVAVEIAPRRPDSSRRGKRRSPSRQQKDPRDVGCYQPK